MRRETISELLDDDIGTPAEIASSLDDLRAINSRFGGVNTTVALLRRVAASAGSRKLTILDVASGSGALVEAAKRQLGADGITVVPTLLDRRASHLTGAAGPAVAGDALRLPFRDEAFDVVSCCLFAHHLTADELRQFVSEGLRVCRHVVLINDLIRSRLHLWLVYLGLPSFHSQVTRHDAPASVRNAYTVREMRRLLRDLRADHVDISRHYLFRMGVLAWKGDAEENAGSKSGVARQ